MNKRLLEQAERLIRRIRNSPKLFADCETAGVTRSSEATREGILTADKASRTLTRALARYGRRKRLPGAVAPEPVGPYSGLTRRELRQSGTCETDWF